MNAEIRRKSFHLIGLLIPICYHYLTKISALWILGIICILYLGVEIYRKSNHKFNHFFINTLRPIMRDSEHYAFAGTTYFLSGCWLTILFFDKDIAMLAIYLFIWSDLAAALAGKYWGNKKIIFNKSLEGSVAALIVALVTGVFCKPFIMNGLDMFTLCIASFLCAFLELFSPGNWDNFTIPIGAGLGITFFPVLMKAF